MVKSITVNFNDDDFDILQTAKGEDRSWRNFILTLVTSKKTK